MDPTGDEYRARTILVRFGYEAEHRSSPPKEKELGWGIRGW